MTAFFLIKGYWNSRWLPNGEKWYVYTNPRNFHLAPTTGLSIDLKKYPHCRLGHLDEPFVVFTWHMPSSKSKVIDLSDSLIFSSHTSLSWLIQKSWEIIFGSSFSCTSRLRILLDSLWMDSDKCATVQSSNGGLMLHSLVDENFQSKAAVKFPVAKPILWFITPAVFYWDL